MPHLFTFNGQGTFSPDGKVTATADEAKTINAQTDTAELEYWATKPDTFSPAYYSFPAETNTILGMPRSYRRNFTPNLYTFINRAKPEDPGTDKHAEVKTWNGSLLGRITSARVYGHNFGGRMVSITVRGTNGASYYGRASWDNGSIIRLRKVKE